MKKFDSLFLSASLLLSTLGLASPASASDPVPSEEQSAAASTSSPGLDTPSTGTLLKNKTIIRRTKDGRSSSMSTNGRDKPMGRARSGGQMPPAGSAATGGTSSSPGGLQTTPYGNP
ncbi:MAG: hypothetical protein H7301_10480 [Cryobacterium sp.]|nr:hypothetical protein [Oligoflexia bacterium]